MITKNIKIPDINHYSEFRPFLNDFIKLNKEHNKKFSLRFFAKKLRWSVSYLNDLIKGRRAISLQKALELSDYLELKGVRAERLVLLTLSATEGVSDKFREILAVRNSGNIVHTMHDGDPKILGSILIFRVITYLIWRHGVWDESDFIARSRRPNQEKIDPAELQFIIQTLEKRKIIQWDLTQQRYSILQDEIYEHWLKVPDKQDIVNLEKDYCRHYVSFLDDISFQIENYGKWSYYSGTIQIPDDRLAEVDDRMRSLRNYLNEIDRQTMDACKLNPDLKNNVYEFSLHHFPVFLTDELLKKQSKK